MPAPLPHPPLIHVEAVSAGFDAGRPVHRGLTLRIDEKDRVLYFLGMGREQGRDPYYTHFYRIGIDGKGQALLTPEDAHHQVSASPVGSTETGTPVQCRFSAPSARSQPTAAGPEAARSPSPPGRATCRRAAR